MEEEHVYITKEKRIAGRLTEVVRIRHSTLEYVDEMIESLLEDFKNSTKVSEKIRLGELLIQLLSKF